MRKITAQLPKQMDKILDRIKTWLKIDWQQKVYFQTVKVMVFCKGEDIL